MIALVQSATVVQVDASGATTFDLVLNGTVGGNALVFLPAIFDNNTTWTIGSVADAGNTWTVRECTATRAQKVGACVAWAVNITGGNRTITLSLSGTFGGNTRYLTYGGQEWSGIATSGAEDTWDANSEIDITSADVSAGPITTTNANDLLVGIACVTSSDPTMNYASPTSWTNSYRENDNSNHQGLDAGYWLPGAIQTAYTAQWAHDNAVHDGGGVIVAFKPAVIGLPPVPARRMIGVMYVQG